MERVQRRNSSEWAEIISEQELSGLSAKTFCKGRSIGSASFYQWRRRLKGHTPESKGKADATEGFIEVAEIGSSAISNPASNTPCQISLELGDGLKLTLRRG